MARVRSLLREVLTRRYAGLVALMLVVAAGCVLAGTWQIARYDDKHVANDDLRANARDAVVPVAALLPLVGAGRTPDADSVEFRDVRATGTYETDGQVLLRNQQVGDATGYVVITPLRTDAGPVLLVARGFVAADTVTLRPSEVSPPPTGEVTVEGRVQASDTAPDDFAALGNGQVDSVDATAAASRLGTDVYAGYVELAAGGPGTNGLTALPPPDLSNPAGGAFEWQHLAYVIQWYLFAGLALAGPFVVVKVDRKRAAEEERGVAAHLALAAPRAGSGPAIAAGDSRGGDLVRQDGDDEARARDVEAYQRHVEETTARLADRYGRR